MPSHRSSLITSFVIVAAVVTFGSNLTGQVGKGAIVDVNSAAENTLHGLPHMTPPIVKGLLANRPFASVVELNKL